MMAELPRLMVAGLAGDTGKSLVALGLVRALRARGLAVAPFKKGPDFIDAAWLGAAAGVPGRNLDTFIMPREAILGSVARAAESADVAVIEGNRGVFDGLDAEGSHSSAELAKLIGAPVVLVIDVTKVTRTAAALVAGCRTVDPRLDICAVILNRVGTGRQEALIREAIARETDLPVLGAVPRLRDRLLPSRHLGLVTEAEHPDRTEALDRVGAAVAQHVDVEALHDLARDRSGPLDAPASSARAPAETRVHIGVLRDRAFSFYYPENLSALEAAGASLREISPLEDDALPEIDGLYAGGGFPEMHAEQLAANKPLRQALARRIADGLPVWAECGGLMYLSRGVVKDGEEHPMVGALPVTVEHSPRPQGHGYVAGRVAASNRFFDEGVELRGHEFHYSRLRDDPADLDTVLRLERGVGVGGGRDGIRVGGVVAAYTHLHALGTAAWAPGLVAAAEGRHV